MTCQNIEDNVMVLNAFNCQIPAIYYGQHLDDFIPKDTTICSNAVTKSAIDMIKKKTSNCSRTLTCKMTRFTYIFKELKESYEKNENVVWMLFSNPEVINYHTYISYDILSLVGEVGGILGLTLGVSALTFFGNSSHRLDILVWPFPLVESFSSPSQKVSLPPGFHC